MKFRAFSLTMLKRPSRRELTASLIGGLAAGALAAEPAGAACSRAITITETAQMNFGTIGVAAAGGRVTLSPSGTVSGPPGAFLAGAPAAGSFHVRGSHNCAVAISLTPGALTGPGSPMTITNFTTDAGPNPILTHGKFTFSVGADLVVNAGQAAGNYNGTYTVTVIY